MYTLSFIAPFRSSLRRDFFFIYIELNLKNASCDSFLIYRLHRIYYQLISGNSNITPVWCLFPIQYRWYIHVMSFNCLFFISTRIQHVNAPYTFIAHVQYDASTTVHSLFNTCFCLTYTNYYIENITNITVNNMCVYFTIHHRKSSSICIICTYQVCINTNKRGRLCGWILQVCFMCRRISTLVSVSSRYDLNLYCKKLCYLIFLKSFL